jgi:hypothetical protein
MVLDPATLALISAVIAGLQVLAFVVLARLNPEMRGVRLWAWSSFASAASMLADSRSMSTALAAMRRSHSVL